MRIDKIVTIERYNNNGSAYPLEKQSREYHGLIYLIGKSNKVSIGGKSYLNQAGTVIYLPYQSQYRVELPDDYISCHVINFIGEVDFNYIIQEGCFEILPLFEEAVRIWRRHRDDEYYRLDSAAITYRLFAELLRRRDRSAPPYRKKERLVPVIEKIHDCYGTPELKISELSGLIGVSERYLCEIFNEVYGMSPKRYLAELRLRRAKELLSGHILISEVSKITGFRDVYHFSSFFKKECGTPPSEYRAEKPVV